MPSSTAGRAPLGAQSSSLLLQDECAGSTTGRGWSVCFIFVLFFLFKGGGQTKPGIM